MENKIYYIFNQNDILGVFTNKLTAYSEYNQLPKSEWCPLEVIELSPEFGTVDSYNTITTLLLNNKPYKCVINDTKKAQELIDLYEELKGTDDYRLYGIRVDIHK